jgi:hypothetical protein
MGKIRRSPLKVLHFKLYSTLIPQLHHLFFLVTSQPGLTPTLISLGWSTPIPQKRLKIRKYFATSAIGLTRGFQIGLRLPNAN